jgi:hypothetical protein
MDPIVALLLFLLVFLQILNHIERKRLVDQVMSKDYTEYKSWDSTKAKVPQKILSKKDKIYL